MNSSTLAMNRRTWPKRCVSQPVSGTAIALATAKLVMTQVPCVELTPRSPEMAGSDTFAIEVSSTFMKVAADSAIVPQTRAEPSSGGGGGRQPRRWPSCDAWRGQIGLPCERPATAAASAAGGGCAVPRAPAHGPGWPR